MDPLGFELGQASCFDQELLPVRAGRRECREKLGSVTVLRMPEKKSQLLVEHGGPIAGHWVVWGERNRGHQQLSTMTWPKPG